ncbi:hypothetical protein [Arcticibacter tournemirensis]|uniref:Uncharacterized protein n=1 Tax=Arcticibacter tournemirensis TaxID=699437 RepID=A0A4Q0M5V0_9SPHI|nr:hypothetical protein [Arcticibacter tournemirensis]RXF68401.1 hypothetical protein EKH83_16095 [Arcticibacter tournemirensis]
MGQIIKGANGEFSGKVGSVIGSNWCSIDYIWVPPAAAASRQRIACFNAVYIPANKTISLSLSPVSILKIINTITLDVYEV